MKYVEFFGFPLSGKSTLLMQIKKCGGRAKSANTVISLKRFLSISFFILTNKKTRTFYTILPIKPSNLFQSIRPFFSFASRYKEYSDYCATSEFTVLEEGLAQSIWGILTFFDYKNYKEDLPIIINRAFDILCLNNLITVVVMKKIDLVEFKKRSRSREKLHRYIKCVIKNKTDEIDKHTTCYELILNEVKNRYDLTDSSSFINNFKNEN